MKRISSFLVTAVIVIAGTYAEATGKDLRSKSRMNLGGYLQTFRDKVNLGLKRGRFREVIKEVGRLF